MHLDFLSFQDRYKLGPGVKMPVDNTSPKDVKQKITNYIQVHPSIAHRIKELYQEDWKIYATVRDR